jgi:hypothetical protein
MFFSRKLYESLKQIIFMLFRYHGLRSPVNWVPAISKGRKTLVGNPYYYKMSVLCLWPTDTNFGDQKFLLRAQSGEKRTMVISPTKWPLLTKKAFDTWRGRHQKSIERNVTWILSSDAPHHVKRRTDGRGLSRIRHLLFCDASCRHLFSFALF